ncbi:redoxin domain-containing protein [Phenylobacterium sp.]|uniref:redoxin domain-containing protein n=1 Tax=Phenylobacterium sp. TaxID=1871053 RepID=UPI002DE41097|nr:redoxin domain-containing protein [Phenylobacterium sp.]
MLTRRILLAAAGLAAAFPALAAPELNAPAPAFRATDETGKTRSLEDFKGKIVVLEWTSDACPYSHKHYDSGNMQRLQAKARRDGVVWLTVMTAPPRSAEFMTPAEVVRWKRKVKSHATAVLIDDDAKVARAYEAKTTPHMFIVDRAGRLVYMGGIDDRPYVDPASLKGATNYVALALADLKAHRPVAQPVTRPYGCSVKYAPTAPFGG